MTGEEASPSPSKGSGEPYHQRYGSLGDGEGYSEGGSFSGRDSYMDEKEGELRGYDFDMVGIPGLPHSQHTLDVPARCADFSPGRLVGKPRCASVMASLGGRRWFAPIFG